VLAVLATGLAFPGRLAAQDYAPPPPPPPPSMPEPPTPPSPPGGFPVEIGGDRPRGVPQRSRAYSLPDTGIEIGVGALVVNLDSRVLNVQQGPGPFLSDGLQFTAAYLLGDWRLEYGKLLLRRDLPKRTPYGENLVTYLAVDADQFMVFYGWRPIYPLYLGGGLGYEHRVVRIMSTVATLTDNPLLAAVLAEWAVAPPVTLQLRAFQEQQMDLLTLSGMTLQFGAVVPW
jgi:hypothetical protein